MAVYPSKGLAIAVITNGSPVGLPEGIVAEFADVVRYGASTNPDWVSYIGPHILPPETADNKKYSVAASNPTKAKPNAAYVGRYANRFYGPLTVGERDGGLTFTVGPNKERWRLEHYSGDEFFFTTTGEDESGLSGATFKTSGGRATALTIGAWNHEGLGTFTRA